jgi:putative oxygen-independent coproporphyrinogen III oxidase
MMYGGSGLYIHIPFCKSKCYYCDFFSITDTAGKKVLMEAMCEEIRLESTLSHAVKPALQTIYFGGGTPSMLNMDDFCHFFSIIDDCFDLSDLQEVTLEANPDDLSSVYIDGLRSLPFNRISIGIQSLNDDELKTINRRHTAAQAINAVKACKTAGFENISIDLMYGLPGQTLESLRETVTLMLDLPITHISTYALSWEEGSVLYAKRQAGLLHQATDEMLETCYAEINNRLNENGFNRYELSNFSLPGFASRHNSSYWDGTTYYGIGPGAHSYNGKQRWSNVSSINQYIEGMRLKQPTREVEELDLDTRYNDYIMTGLRTTVGLLLKDLEKQFGIAKRYYCMLNANKNLLNGLLKYENGYLRINDKGLFLADSICSDLMSV